MTLSQYIKTLKYIYGVEKSKMYKEFISAYKIIVKYISQFNFKNYIYNRFILVKFDNNFVYYLRIIFMVIIGFYDFFMFIFYTIDVFFTIFFKYLFLYIGIVFYEWETYIYKNKHMYMQEKNSLKLQKYDEKYAKKAAARFVFFDNISFAFERDLKSSLNMSKRNYSITIKYWNHFKHFVYTIWCTVRDYLLLKIPLLILQYNEFIDKRVLKMFHNLYNFIKKNYRKPFEFIIDVIFRIIGIIKFFFHRIFKIFFKIKLYFFLKREIKKSRKKIRDFCIEKYYYYGSNDKFLDFVNIDKAKIKIPHYIPGFAMTNIKIAYYLHRKGYVINEYFNLLQRNYFHTNKINREDDLSDFDDSFLFFKFLSLELHIILAKFFDKWWPFIIYILVKAHNKSVNVFYNYICYYTYIGFWILIFILKYPFLKLNYFLKGEYIYLKAFIRGFFKRK